jgi:Holliday junction resolvasome RuvABC endonuclease subunit
MRNKHDRVLAVYPTRTGFGWALFEEPSNPVDWGVAAVRENKNAGCFARIEGIIDQYGPSVIILEQFEGPGSRRALRIQRLCRSIVALAHTRDIAVRVYSRDHVKTSFAKTGATSRYEIATAIAKHIDAIAHMLPAKRKIWMPEDPRMGLFNAAALAVTYFAGSEGFDD